MIGYALLGLIVLLMVGAYQSAGKRLDDPNDQSVLHLEQVPAVANLTGSGVYHLTIWRQSGNVHQSWTITGTAAQAVSQMLSTFRRARIPAVAIKTNTESELDVWRLFHNHRGRAEGKRVGGATIQKVA